MIDNLFRFRLHDTYFIQFENFLSLFIQAASGFIGDLRPIISKDSTMFSGVSYGRGASLTSTCLKSILREAFTSNTRAILMSNGASVYKTLEVGTHGVCEKYSVNHAQFEYCRSEKVGNCKAYLSPLIWGHLSY